MPSPRCVADTMAFYRIYTGEDNWSRFEELSLDALPDINDAIATTRFFVKRFDVATDLDWHPAPRRMMTVLLAGELELEFRNGSRLKIHPGDVRLMEDTTGNGHRTRVVSGQMAVIGVLPLGDTGPRAGSS